MTSPLNARLALLGAVLVAGGAIVGSASALLAIATAAHMAAPWWLPVSLDLVALVAAGAIRSRRRDPLAWATLLTATALSTTLQVLDAPDDILARVSHGAPPVAALLAFELAMRAANNAPAEAPSPKPAKAPRPQPSQTRPAPPSASPVESDP